MTKKLPPDTQADFPPREPNQGLTPPSTSEWWRRFLNTCRANRGKTISAGLVLFVVLALGFADALLAGPMRNWAERAMNSKLKGYH